MATLEKLLVRKLAAEVLGVSPKTLERWAVTGGGPVYVLCGSKANYKPSDLSAWIEARRVRNSAEEPGSLEREGL